MKRAKRQKQRRKTLLRSVSESTQQNHVNSKVVEAVLSFLIIF